jgi:hypothetical protein
MRPRSHRSGISIACRDPEVRMPEKEVLERAEEDARQGKSPSTQAGEFVHEEIDHVKEGKHGARSTKQAIAIGLSKARRAGVDLPAPKDGTVSAETRKQISRDSAKGHAARTQPGKTQKVSRERSRATTAALQREPHDAASHEALSDQARSSARQRSPASRENAARKAVRTKGEAGLRSAGQKAARTRASHQG